MEHCLIIILIVPKLVHHDSLQIQICCIKQLILMSH